PQRVNQAQAQGDEHPQPHAADADVAQRAAGRQEQADSPAEEGGPAAAQRTVINEQTQRHALSVRRRRGRPRRQVGSPNQGEGYQVVNQKDREVHKRRPDAVQADSQGVRGDHQEADEKQERRQVEQTGGDPQPAEVAAQGAAAPAPVEQAGGDGGVQQVQPHRGGNEVRGDDQAGEGSRHEYRCGADAQPFARQALQGG